ncbi:MobA/MobL family protein [Sphingomonas ginsenosidimutans]|uniref:MobA/MobL family protein n=1 Tax=Sphingomonas ginsenosidimutans TaxID=862134 RepID=UPI001D78FAAA|nr:MobA/MobL family protein [Sphingomonas ginsenosidimutans]MBY0300139.1 MobA/MobL family protein [Sphingomonas ginsenosidimutans]
MKQARDEARKQAKIRRHEKAVEVQMALEDRAAARRLMRELAEVELDRIRYAARIRVLVRPDKPETRTSPVEKRLTLTPLTNRTVTRVHAASSWVIDDRGMRGVIWQQSYFGRKSPNFYRGAARDNWEYDVRDEAVLRDAEGEPVIISNMGDDWIEIGAAWQAMEDASVRKNAKIQIRAIAPFDADMSQEEMILALRHFCETVLEPLGLPYSAVIHRPSDGGDERNFHPHLAFSLRPMRRVEPYCWEVADEVRGELDGKDGVQMLRHLWAHSMSEAAEWARSNRRYTGLGYGARGLDLEAGEHLGEGRAAMVKRGDNVWAHERNRIKNARNAARRAIRDADRKIAALTKVRDAAVANMAARSEGDVRTRVVSSARPGIGLAPLKCSSHRQASDEMLAVSSISPERPPLVASTGREKGPRHRVSLVASQKPHVSPMPMKPAVETTRFSPMPLRSSRRLRNEAVQPLITSRQPEPPDRLVLSKPVTILAKLKVAKTIGERAPPLIASRADAGLVPTLSVRAKVAGTLKPPLVPSSRASHTDLKAAAKIDELLHALAAARVERDKKRAAARNRAKEASRPTALQDEDVQTSPTEPKPVKLAQSQSPPSVRTVPIVSQQGQRCRRRWASDDRNITPTRTELDTREWLEAHPRMPFEANGAPLLDAADRLQLDGIRNRDVYVSDYGGGTSLTIDGAKAHAMGVSDEWLARPEIQRALGEIRADQQKVVTEMLGEADRRPLDFSRHGIRIWPRDLDPSHLKRLDRWAADEGFQHDMFGTEQRIRAAHYERDRKARETVARRVTPTTPVTAIPDAFGGWLSTPLPPFTGERPAVRVSAFDRTTGKPTEQLLMLLDLVAKHPRRVIFASDGRLMAAQGAPMLMPSLLHGWRHDQRISDLVVATVRASREAGRPAWPPEFAPAMRAYNARSAQHSGRAPIDWSSGPSR